MVELSDWQPSTSNSGQEASSATSTVTAKGKRKAMCEPEEISLPHTPPPSQASPQICPQSSPDNIAIRYSPKLAQRMQRDTCFRCHKQGHWAVDCPLKSPNTVKIYCRCGHGFCEVKTANTERNKGRKYYACPIKRGKRCCSWIKWCDDPISESDSLPPPYKYPECGGCHGGVCRKEKEVNGPNAGRYYFACPVQNKHGDCGFRVWEDDVLNTPNAVPVRESCQKTLRYFWGPTDVNNVDSENCAASVIPAQQSCRRTLRYSWEPTDVNNVDSENHAASVVPAQQSCQRTVRYSWEPTDDNNDLNKVADLNLEHSKRMRIMDDSQHLPIEAESKVPHGDDTAPNKASVEKRGQDDTTALSVPLDHVGFPESEVSNISQDLDMLDSVLWDAIMEEALSVSASSRILSRDKVFERQISALVNGPFGGSCLMGWLGRLVFFYPMKTLKFSSPQSFFCFPKQECAHHSPSEVSNQLVIENPGQHMQCLTGINTKVSRNMVCPSGSPGKGRKPMSKVERQRQMAVVAQQQLLDDLETLNPLDHESMREAAEATFDGLNCLSIDYKHFSKHVLQFINCASSLSEIEKSIENFGSPEEQIQHCKDVEARLENIRANHVRTKASLEVSHQRRESLREEVSHLKTMLYEMENRLISSEEETLKIETDLTGINRNMSEVERNLQTAAEQLEAARKLSKEKQVQQSVAKAALEKAKLVVGK